jgi:arginyl-tRNA synthetase
MSLLQLLQMHAKTAFTLAGAPDAPPVVQLASKPEFGDYQINGCMGAAKALKTNPRALAESVLAHLSPLQTLGIVRHLEIAGPGFINVHLNPLFVAEQLKKNAADPQLGCQTAEPKHIMVEYSSPNLAKEMHVGHLRSTIIGDALAKILGFMGHKVTLCNHVGDWGTQFGMLIAYLLETEKAGQSDIALSDLEHFYRQAKLRFDESEDFAERARALVVRLQSGDAEILAYWRQFVDVSMTHCEATYRRLNVGLTRAAVRGESAYNADLKTIVQELEAAGLAQDSDGAKVVYLEQFRTKDDEPMGVIVQKKDGGFLYTTTDLGAIRYRKSLQLDKVIYVVDARQSQHFMQLFHIAKQAQFAPDSLQLEHVGFGVMMGEDGTPFKTRDGGTVKLADLLTEAETRAYQEIERRSPEKSEADKRRIAQVVGMGAVKYADLSKNRLSDYIFNWDSMLSFEGNTAPYLQYAYARTQSVLRKLSDQEKNSVCVQHLALTEPAEMALGVALLQLNDVLISIADSAYPHYLTSYLYHVATLFSRYYEACPILKDDIAADVRASRLALTQLTANTLKTGLSLLGIDVLEAM